VYFLNRPLTIVHNAHGNHSGQRTDQIFGLLTQPCGRHKCSHAIKELKFGYARRPSPPQHATELDDREQNSPDDMDDAGAFLATAMTKCGHTLI